MTACFVNHVQTIAADPAGISVRYHGAPYEEILSVGDQHCAQFGKIAWPVANEPAGDGHGHLDGHVQRFDCVDRAPRPRG